MIANEATHPQETKMTQKLTILGHRTAFNNEQISIKGPEITNVKQFTREH